MVEHSGGLWHYLSSFMIYTLTAVAMIYGVYWLIQRAPGVTTQKPSPPTEEEKPGKLELESSLALDASRTLHVIRTGSERFLLSAFGESTQLLSRLENVPSDVPPEPEPAPESVVEEAPPPPVIVEAPPWYSFSTPPAPPEEPVPVSAGRKSGFADRFVRSVKWLASSRLR